jgi:N-acetylmuramoyl-L-alanine amidase
MLSKALIDKGFSVIITRQDNTTVIGNKERADIAKQNNADLLLRIHANYERNGNQEFK